MEINRLAAFENAQNKKNNPKLAQALMKINHVNKKRVTVYISTDLLKEYKHYIADNLGCDLSKIVNCLLRREIAQGLEHLVIDEN